MAGRRLVKSGRTRSKSLKSDRFRVGFSQHRPEIGHVRPTWGLKSPRQISGDVGAKTTKTSTRFGLNSNYDEQWRHGPARDHQSRRPREHRHGLRRVPPESEPRVVRPGRLVEVDHGKVNAVAPQLRKGCSPHAPESYPALSEIASKSPNITCAPKLPRQPIRPTLAGLRAIPSSFSLGLPAFGLHVTDLAATTA